MNVDIAVSGERDPAAPRQHRVVPTEPRRLEDDDGVRWTADRQHGVEAGNFLHQRRRFRRQQTSVCTCVTTIFIIIQYYLAVKHSNIMKYEQSRNPVSFRTCIQLPLQIR